MAHADVPLIDPATGRFPDEFAPPSVAADAAVAEAARVAAVEAAEGVPDAVADAVTTLVDPKVQAVDQARTEAVTAAGTAVQSATEAVAAAERAEAVPAQVDTAMATIAADPDSDFSNQLSATFVGQGAPNVASPLLVTTPVTITKTGAKAVTGQDPETGLFYGSDTSNGHYVTSPDLTTWTDRTYSPSAYTPSMIGWEFDATYMYVYSTTGRIWRSTKDVFNGWIEITVPGKGPLTTGRPGSLCALGDGVLLYGNYTSGFGDGSHIWRSTDAGATWNKVLTNPGGKHVHAIRVNRSTGVVWASLGDFGHEGAGLWKSTDDGVTWTHMSQNEYGIDMVFVPAREQRPALVVLEGDGLNRPHLVAFPQNGKPGDKTFPLAWFTGAPSDPASTRGTTRGIGLTLNEDIIYWVTTEGGAVGTKAGLYVAQAPYYTRTVLLLDTTGAEPAGYTRTYSHGAYAQNLGWRFPLPTFGTY